VPSTILAVGHKVGLHARPASLFVQAAMRYPCSITVRNITKGSKTVNAKSILGILSMGVKQDHEIEIVTDGDRAEEALIDLVRLIQGNFGENSS
jgi:phosphotransferase system HPr (HPr) family protein